MKRMTLNSQNIMYDAGVNVFVCCQLDIADYQMLTLWG